MINTITTKHTILMHLILIKRTRCQAILKGCAIKWVMRLSGFDCTGLIKNHFLCTTRILQIWGLQFVSNLTFTEQNFCQSPLTSSPLAVSLPPTFAFQMRTTSSISLVSSKLASTSSDSRKKWERSRKVFVKFHFKHDAELRVNACIAQGFL